MYWLHCDLDWGEGGETRGWRARGKRKWCVSDGRESKNDRDRQRHGGTETDREGGTAQNKIKGCTTFKSSPRSFKRIIHKNQLKNSSKGTTLAQKGAHTHAIKGRHTQTKREIKKKCKNRWTKREKEKIKEAKIKVKEESPLPHTTP